MIYFWYTKPDEYNLRVNQEVYDYEKLIIIDFGRDSGVFAGGIC